MASETAIPVLPVGYRLLIEPIKAEEKSRGGIILTSATMEAQGYLTYIGKVVGMGESCYQHPKFNGIAWCQTGDVIAHGKYAGQKVEIKGDDGEYTAYRLLNDDEVLATITDSERVRIYV